MRHGSLVEQVRLIQFQAITKVFDAAKIVSTASPHDTSNAIALGEQ
jgi:hypothetical protein